MTLRPDPLPHFSITCIETEILGRLKINIAKEVVGVNYMYRIDNFKSKQQINESHRQEWQQNFKWTWAKQMTVKHRMDNKTSNLLKKWVIEWNTFCMDPLATTLTCLPVLAISVIHLRSTAHRTALRVFIFFPFFFLLQFFFSFSFFFPSSSPSSHPPSISL